MPLWQIDIYPAAGHLDRDAARTSEQIAELGLGKNVSVSFARGFLIQGDFALAEATRLAETLLADNVTERAVIAIAGQESLSVPPDVIWSTLHGETEGGGDRASAASSRHTTLVNVLPKPGVMDPVAASTTTAAQDADRCARGADVSQVLAERCRGTIARIDLSQGALQRFGGTGRCRTAQDRPA